ncbi:MAG: CHAT domain-containing protein [Syntrophales bacterium]
MNRGLYIIMFVVTLMIGCGALMPEKARLMGAARYEDLARHMEGSISDMHTASNQDLTYLCLAYSNLKNYSKLFPCLDEMQMRIDRGDTILLKAPPPFRGGHGDISLEYEIMRTRAYIETGDYAKAILHGRSVMEFVGPDPVQSRKGHAGRQRSPNLLGATAYTEALHLLGLAYALKGEREEAEECVYRLERTPTHGVAGVADAKYLALAGIHIALGQYKQAREAFELLKREGSDSMRTIGTAVALVLFQVGEEELWSYKDLPKNYAYCKVLLETGDVAQAKKGYDELLKVPQIKVNGTIYWLILFDRGRIAEQEGDLKLTIDSYRRAVDAIERQRSTINTETSKIGFVGDKQAVYRRLIAALFNDKQYSSALEYIERSKSRALVDMLATKKDFAVQTGNEGQVRELLAMTDNSEQEALAQEIRSKKDNTRSVIIKTKEQLQQQASELASLVSVTSISVAEIQKLIPADETLIEYYYTDKELYAFVLTSQGLSAIRLDSGNLAEDIKAFRKSLENASSASYEMLSRQMFNKLMKPVEGSLHTRKLIIVPHGVLHYLPFYALHDGKDYVIERYSIRMLPSASVINYLQRQKVAKAGDILAFGNPDLGDSKYDLIYAQNEAIAVSKTRPRSKVFLRKEATETALEKYGAGFSYIHFATHGEFDADKHLNSALLLAADAESDGKLTVDKLYSMKLDADLITMSACETGLSKIANGDDLVGLTRGFLYAGSSSIVASLWKVDDLATAELMTRFYRELESTDKREALRTAQLETKKKYPHPYYWASFQLTGNAK